MNARHFSPLLLMLFALTPAWAQHPESIVRSPAGTLNATGTDYTIPLPGSRLAALEATALGGFFASVDYLSYNADIAIDAGGGVHLAFYFSNEKHEDDPPGQPAYYTYCPGTADCLDPNNFSALIQFSSTEVNEVQVVATSDGRPRVLARRNGSQGNDYHFWSCDEQCTQGSNWVGLNVTTAAGVELFNADLPQHAFALDAQDRPRFVYSNSWGLGRPDGVYYTFCDAADCTEPGSWQETKITFTVEFKTVTSDYATLVFDGDKPRVLTRYNESGLPVRMEYYACDANCGDPSGWARTIITHPEGKMWANWDLALDAAGQPHIALYEAAGIDIRVGGKLFYGWCEAGCSDVNATFRIVQVAEGEGKNVDLAIAPDGRTYMVYDAGQRGVLGTVWCDDDCTNSAQWKRQILQTSEELQQEFAPASPISCAQNEEQGRAWLDAIPSTAFDDQGRLVVAYDVKHVAICYYTDPADPDPVWSRVERLWWAVRVGFYEKPDDTGTPNEEEPTIPAGFGLEQNYPNPFNPSTLIHLELPSASHVELVVYDALGREVRRLVDEPLAAGTHQIAFEADHLPSGVYVYRVTAGAFTQARRMVLLR